MKIAYSNIERLLWKKINGKVSISIHPILKLNMVAIHSQREGAEDK